ncbi:MAG: glycerophosphodiester phosphodiesterase family protein [Pseudomonadota bacterium]
MPSDNRPSRAFTRLSPFYQPIAHRGLHDQARGITENSPAAFRAACAANVAIECDIRLGNAGAAIVFHDADLARVMGRPERLADLPARALAAIPYPGTRDTILSIGDLFDLVDGTVPLMCELKVDGADEVMPLVDAVLDAASAYRGAIALKSFSADAVARIRDKAPTLPRGIVARDDTWAETASPETRAILGAADRMAHLLDSGPAAPHFISYRASDLKNSVVRYLRQVVGLPVFAWTIASRDDLLAARPFADVPVFEALTPEEVRGLWSFDGPADADGS